MGIRPVGIFNCRSVICSGLIVILLGFYCKVLWTLTGLKTPIPPCSQFWRSWRQKNRKREKISDNLSTKYDFWIDTFVIYFFLLCFWGDKTQGQPKSSEPCKQNSSNLWMKSTFWLAVFLHFDIIYEPKDGKQVVVCTLLNFAIPSGYYPHINIFVIGFVPIPLQFAGFGILNLKNSRWNYIGRSQLLENQITSELLYIICL